MARNSLIKLFEANDGRLAASQILYVRQGERVNLISSNWGCEEGEILVYKFLHYSENSACDPSLMALWTEDVSCGPLETVEVPRIRLTCANVHDIINEHGQYLLVRARNAQEVNVFAKYDQKPR